MFHVKENGKKRFSVTKLAHILIPNFFEDESIPRLDSLLPQRRDMLYYHQIHKSDPYGLDGNSCYMSGIVDTESLSKKVFRCLQKAQICDVQGHVDTRKIDGKKFMHQILVIDNRRQRELVNMLFWWEEECSRLRALKSEETELTQAIHDLETSCDKPQDSVVPGYAELDTDSALVHRSNAETRHIGLDDDQDRRQMLDRVRFARERVRMRIRQKPSQRRADIEAGKDNLTSQSLMQGRRCSEISGSHSRSAELDSRNKPRSSRVGDRHDEVGLHRNDDPPLYYK